MEVAGMKLSREKIREFVRYLRETCGLKDDLYFPIVQFIEFGLANPICSDFNYEIVTTEDMGDMYGVTNTSDNTMKIREDVYWGAVKGVPRDRFTLCHELGHYFLHQPEFMSFARGDIPYYRNPEWQANTFAGELMAPYDLTRNMDADEIMKKCGMSRQAATIQYKEYHR